MDKLEFTIRILRTLLHNSPSLRPFLCRFDSDKFWSNYGLDQKCHFVEESVSEASVDSRMYDNPGAQKCCAQA